MYNNIRSILSSKQYLYKRASRIVKDDYFSENEGFGDLKWPESGLNITFTWGMFVDRSLQLFVCIQNFFFFTYSGPKVSVPEYWVTLKLKLIHFRASEFVDVLYAKLNAKLNFDSGTF